MKKHQNTALITASAFLFNIFFWKESLAINLCLFNTLLLLSLMLKFKPKWSRVLGLHLSISFISAIGVVWHGSSFAVFTHILSVVATVGVIQRSDIYNVFFAALSWINNVFVWRRAKERLKSDNESLKWTHRVWYYLKIVALPIVVIWIFFLLYKGANPVFEKYSTTVIRGFSAMWVRFFENISLGRILFFIVGLLMCSGAFIIKERNRVYRYYNTFQSNLQRIRRKHIGSMVSLKMELKAGMFLLVAINVLLFIVNAIDISWIWFGFTVPENFDLKQFVHQGTYLLIVSIILAMVIMFYFFRGNLNFLKSNATLVKLSYLWIAQNMVLVVSVFLRNTHYISFHGLAYGRIGVIVFLLLTLFGLAALLLKIRDKKTSYYTFQFTSIAFVIVFGCMSLFNWDKIICDYNLSFGDSANIDPAFYLRLSPSVYPIIYENRAIVHQQIKSHAKLNNPWYAIKSTALFDAQLDQKAKRFLERRKDKTWLSWSIAKNSSEQYLKEERLIAQAP